MLGAQNSRTMCRPLVDGDGACGARGRRDGIGTQKNDGGASASIKKNKRGVVCGLVDAHTKNGFPVCSPPRPHTSFAPHARAGSWARPLPHPPTSSPHGGRCVSANKKRPNVALLHRRRQAGRPPGAGRRGRQVQAGHGHADAGRDAGESWREAFFFFVPPLGPASAAGAQLRAKAAAWTAQPCASLGTRDLDKRTPRGAGSLEAPAKK